ncbi:MAG TPA: hypothetical protein VNT55_08255 [Baekduia sp.]|nr:hypothetical protein [Baekduia sp.]
MIIPNTYGLPVAFFGAPNENALASDVDVDFAAVLLVDELALSELLDPQPAASSPVAATAATVPTHLEDLMCALLLLYALLDPLVGSRQATAASPR